MVLYEKPYRTPDELIALLRDRGMAITDEPAAAGWLERVGYYRLSGYWHPMRAREEGPRGKALDHFMDGARFEHVAQLYVFDKRLRLTLLDALERVEIALRAQLSAEISAVNPFAHRDPEMFDRSFLLGGTDPNHATWLAHLDRQTRQSKDDFAKHFKEKYGKNSSMPIWMAVELTDFGGLSKLYAGLRTRHQRPIAQAMAAPRPELLESWLKALAQVRNIAAHHGRLWNKPLSKRPTPPDAGEVQTLSHVSASPNKWERLYAACAILQYLLRRISRGSDWGARLAAQMKGFPVSDVLSFKTTGFPEDWRTQPLWSAP